MPLGTHRPPRSGFAGGPDRDTKRPKCRAPMKCAVCHKEWKRLDVYCPGCGAPVTARPRSMAMEVFLVAAALGLLVCLLKVK